MFSPDKDNGDLSNIDFTEKVEDIFADTSAVKVGISAAQKTLFANFVKHNHQK
jgi:hypothetical protein